MTPTRRMTRRSFLGRVAGGAALLMAGAAAPAAAEQVSDSDGSDPAGRGRTGYSDRDQGVNADRRGHGRRGRRLARTNLRPCTRRSGVTDRDRGNGADPPGCGRR
jgi:opacity protein-like surface antigen